MLIELALIDALRQIEGDEARQQILESLEPEELRRIKRALDEVYPHDPVDTKAA